jgi:peptidoglycan/xylan/chitin deacetylase (PgdA/CDA1 family)
MARIRGRACAVAAVCTLVAVALSSGDRAEARPSSSEAVPILMYHVIAAPPVGAAYPELYVDRPAFAREVAWLAAHGFHAVTLQALYDHWHGAPLPMHPVVFTFDDGYRSQYANALPILRAHRWPGVLDLTVRNERDRWGMPPRLVHSLIRAGWEIDAHSINHPDLTMLDAARLSDEVQGARTLIGRQFHVPVNFFCYPAGHYDSTVVAAVRKAGYLGATSTEYGLARSSDLFALDRVRVNGDDGVSGLVAKLRALGVA